MSRYSSRFLESLAAAAAVAAALLAFAPASQAAELKNGAEISFGASYSSNDEDSQFDLSSWGLRYHYDFNDRWGIEGAYTNQDQDSIDADIYEASARFTFFENDRVRVFGLAGAGVFSYDYVFFVGEDALVVGNDDVAVYHLGIGAEVNLGDRFYLRPDLRQRWAVDFFSAYDDSTSEATLAFGFRF